MCALIKSKRNKLRYGECAPDQRTPGGWKCEDSQVLATEGHYKTELVRDAYDETVVATPAWDVKVLVKAAWTETIKHDAEYKTVHHPAEYGWI